VTAPLSTLRALVREEQTRLRFPELGVVTQVFPKSSDGGKENHQVAVSLPSSGVELLRANVAVARVGLAALPRVGDLVLVVFVDGDLNAPIVVGSLYDNTNHPPKAEADEVVYQVPDGAASGVRRLHVELPSGATVTIDDDTLSIVFGGTSVEVKRDGDVTVQSAANVSITASGDLTLEAQGNVGIKAAGKLDLSGVELTAQGTGAASLKGAQVSIGGVTQFSPS
jgi:phage baseplate assembly protein gpV